jgi:hypothetical protein
MRMGWTSCGFSFDGTLGNDYQLLAGVAHVEEHLARIQSTRPQRGRNFGQNGVVKLAEQRNLA